MLEKVTPAAVAPGLPLQSSWETAAWHTVGLGRGNGERAQSLGVVLAETAEVSCERSTGVQTVPGTDISREAEL